MVDFPLNSGDEEFAAADPFSLTAVPLSDRFVFNPVLVVGLKESGRVGRAAHSSYLHDTRLSEYI